MSDDGEDSPPPRPTRKIRKIVLVSSSGSESDDSGPATSTRKKRPRVLSDVDSESSGSSVAVGSRRRRALPSLRDSGGDSDTSGWATDHSDAARAAKVEPSNCPKPASGFASDSSEGNSDKCSICLMRFTNQQVGTPQTCEHLFCLDCITEWSRNVNTCPVDRLTFDNIVVRACAGGRVLSLQPVQVVERAASMEMLFEEQPTSCQICGSLDREETMLLCDGCDLGFHMECLTPPLSEVPRNQWLCPNCSDRFYEVDVAQASEVELYSDASETEEGGGVRSAWRRLVDRARRTGGGDGGSRATRPRRGPAPPDLPTTSRSAVVLARAGAPTARRTRPRKRRRARTLIIEYELGEDGKRALTKRVRRKLKRRKTRRRQPRTAARRTHVRESVRAKLTAQRLERSFAAATIAACNLGPKALSGVVPALNLFGSARDLEYFSDEELETGGDGGVVVAARAVPTSAAIAAYRQARRKMVSIPSPTHASAAPDILSSILESQTLLHSKRSVVSVAHSGELDIKLKPQKGERRPAIQEKPDGAKTERVDVTRGAGVTRQAPSYPGQPRGGGGWGGGYRYPPERAPAPGANSRGYDNGYGGAPSNRNDRHRASEGDAFHSYGEHRPLRYDEPFDRDRDRRRPFDQDRRPPHSTWRPHRPDQRHSFGGFDNPLDMRTERPQEKPQPRYGPLPEPPVFAEPPDEDEPSDSSLIIDTDKYDPTEPTDDDELPAASGQCPPPLVPPASLAAVESILAGMEPNTTSVTAEALDSAVRQVLLEHRSLIDLPAVERHDSDDNSDGDCPNFSIYSATSVHIASSALDEPARDLPSPPPPPPSPPPPPPPPVEDTPHKRKSEQYNEKVSKRCPITTNTRNPIKIKLNTPALIRRQVSLYDEEDEQVPTEGEAPDLAKEPPEEPPQTPEPTPDSEKRADHEDEKEKADEELTPEPEINDEPITDEPAPETSEERDPDNPVRDDSRTPSLPDEQALNAVSSPHHALGTSPEKLGSGSPVESGGSPRVSPVREKMTESISETEDERSYTPCLDEHRDEPERGLEGLDTELISEDEGNGLFSEEEPKSPAPKPPSSVTIAVSAPTPDEAPKKKKKKDKETKSKDKKSKTKVVFKKVGKGKERKYRSRSPSRSGSESVSARQKREKRKDLERYDVRNVVSEKRRRVKDAFGRDVSPRAERSPSIRRRSSDSAPRASPSPRRARPSPSPRRIRASPSPRRIRTSVSPRRIRTSVSPRRVRASPSPRRNRPSPSPRRIRGSPSPRRVRASPSPSPPIVKRSTSPRVTRRRRRSTSRGRRVRRRTASRTRKRRRSGSAPTKPKTKKKKRARSERPRSRSRDRKSPKRKRARRAPAAEPLPAAWSPRPASPRTPPPQPVPLIPIEARRLRKRRDRSKHRRNDVTGPSKEVFTSGDNILVSVSFKEQEGDGGASRRERRRERRRRRRAAQDEAAPPKPVAIIDLARSPFRELTPSPERVIVLSDEEPPPPAQGQGAPAQPPPAAAPAPAGPQTPPPAPQPAAPSAEEGRGPNTPPEPPDSPDAYDPYEPTASPAPEPAPSPSPSEPPSPHRPSMTLEAAQKTNMSADEVLDRRPLSPIEKVMALLQSTRDVPPDPPPEGGASAAGSEPAPQTPAPAAAPRVVLPEPAGGARQPAPKLFLAKPSPIKSDPIKPMQQATKISRLPLPSVRAGGGDSPYSPGSSDFGDLFEPPAPPHQGPSDFDTLFEKPLRRKRNKTLGRNNKKKGKMQVDVKMDDDSLKVLDELPNSAVEMQVKSKFLKKLNRQERVVEEVKLVLKPHYNKKHVTKDEYKHILRRTVPKICHNKTGEINPTKIQSLVVAYVNKFRKKRKLGLS